jgi:hypothetical protein
MVTPRSWNARAAHDRAPGRKGAAARGSLRHKISRGTSAGHPDAPIGLSNLGNVLRLRYIRVGEMANLDEAITLYRQAVMGTPEDHPDLAMYLSNLAEALRIRFARTGELADAGEAVDVGHRAVSAVPADHPRRPLHRLNLGTAMGPLIADRGRGGLG